MYRLCLIASVCVISVYSDEHEYRLITDLLNPIHYNPLERPVENNSLPVKVTLSIVLQQLVGLDEKNQVIEVNAWLKYTWLDNKLHWKPEEYGGITDLRFPHDRIWRPDVLLYNSADQNFDSTYHSNVVVYSDGTINWIPPGILKSSCKIDITWFPFDDQRCYLKFGSWTYNGFALNLQPESTNMEEGMDTSEYLANDEWLLLGTPVERKEKFYTCCPEPYPSLSFYMKIRRRTLYYGVNLIVPSLLISLMTVLGFTLPPDACEKITLEITILLSICFFLGMVANMTPHTSEAIPLIVTFFSCCMLVVSASVVFTVVVLNLHFRTPDTHEMSPFVRTVLLNWLPWLLMMRRPGKKFIMPKVIQKQKGLQTKTDETMQKSFFEGRVAASGVSQVSAVDKSVSGTTVFHTPPLDRQQQDPHTHQSHNHGHRFWGMDLELKIEKCLKPFLAKTAETRNTGHYAMVLMLQRIHKELEFITERMEEDDQEDQEVNDWKFAAMVVDRLCLVVFSAFIVASTCGIMFSAPHLIA